MRKLKAVAIGIAFLLMLPLFFGAKDHEPGTSAGPMANLSVVLGRPTDTSIALSVLCSSDSEASVEYGSAPGNYEAKTDANALKANVPCEFEIASLKPNSKYFYRLLCKTAEGNDFKAEQEGSFQTQRAPGSTFSFAIQGDSHPEREGKMFDPFLYETTMRNVAKVPPDFYIMMGDDFSVERLIERKTLSLAAVNQLYARQRGFLGIIGQSSSVFLVNGNHEHADRCLLDGTENNCAVMSGRARINYFPLPVPNTFYSGDEEEVKYVGLPRDYYAWMWGDALFVVIDFYWHSPVQVDNVAGSKKQGKNGAPKRDLWDVTLGDAQYHWLYKNLTESKARWKFVFCHHALGTGRGGIEEATLCEWGGKDRNGTSSFSEKRPGWPMPIHELMVKSGVTVFFQGHDHIYAHQELDGVVYQSCPNPADQGYQAFNRDAYRSGDVLPNSGHLRVNVSPKSVKVDYIHSFLPADESFDAQNGALAFSYTVPAKTNGSK